MSLSPNPFYDTATLEEMIEVFQEELDLINTPGTWNSINHSSLKTHKRSEIKSWLVENLKGRYCFTQSVCSFEEEEDLVLFTLKWL